MEQGIFIHVFPVSTPVKSSNQGSVFPYFDISARYPSRCACRQSEVIHKNIFPMTCHFSDKLVLPFMVNFLLNEI